MLLGATLLMAWPAVRVACAEIPAGWTAEKRPIKVATPGGEVPKEITYCTNTIGMEFVLIPSGEFTMGGSPGEAGRDDDRLPQHRVRITRPFYLGAHEVTQAQYEKVMGRSRAHFPGARNPVEQVSWYDATRFCAQLSRMERIRCRLPTEAEWEYACRAGTVTRFSFGHDDEVVCKYANYADSNAPALWSDKYHDDRFKFTAPVGSFLPNGFGLHDMHGNVWEWCWDWYGKDYYRQSPTADPAGPPHGRERVTRGGSWYDLRGAIRSCHRYRQPPSHASNFVGFRVVVETPARPRAEEVRPADRDRPLQPDVESQPEKQKPPELPRGWTTAKRTVKVGTPEGETSKEVTCYKNTIAMEFVLVPAGRLMMGSPTSEEGRKKDEDPQHAVSIAGPLYMGAYEVTQAQYEKIMGKNPSKFLGANSPVEQVCWLDASEFCKRLFEKEGAAYRLPTEAEWEYACRAGTTTPFCFGATISTNQAAYDGLWAYGKGKKGVRRKKTVPVGGFPANAFGLHDMHGNVGEWCQSLHRDYPYDAHDGREALDAKGARVVRGGSWNDYPRYVRSARRDRKPPNTRYEHIGFRVVVPAQGGPVAAQDGSARGPQAVPGRVGPQREPAPVIPDEREATVTPFEITDLIEKKFYCTRNALVQGEFCYVALRFTDSTLDLRRINWRLDFKVCKTGGEPYDRKSVRSYMLLELPDAVRKAEILTGVPCGAFETDLPGRSGNMTALPVEGAPIRGAFVPARATGPSRPVRGSTRQRSRRPIRRRRSPAPGSRPSLPSAVPAPAPSVPPQAEEAGPPSTSESQSCSVYLIIDAPKKELAGLALRFRNTAPVPFSRREIPQKPRGPDDSRESLRPKVPVPPAPVREAPAPTPKRTSTVKILVINGCPGKLDLSLGPVKRTIKSGKRMEIIVRKGAHSMSCSYFDGVNGAIMAGLARVQRAETWVFTLERMGMTTQLRKQVVPSGE